VIGPLCQLAFHGGIGIPFLVMTSQPVAEQQGLPPDRRARWADVDVDWPPWVGIYYHLFWVVYAVPVGAGPLPRHVHEPGTPGSFGHPCRGRKVSDDDLDIDELFGRKL
jgi:hypothetical protein